MNLSTEPGVTRRLFQRQEHMKITQEDIDSLTQKLDALTDGEKLALRVAIANHDRDDVQGFSDQRPRISRTEVGLHFDKIEWVWKAPAGTESGAKPSGLLDYDWIA